MVVLSGAEAIVEFLKLEDIPYVFGIAGGGTVPVLDVLAETSTIKYISTRHEQVAAHMADGYARYSGKPGVIFVTRAAGSLNTTLGAATAYSSDSPILIMAFDPPVEALGKGDYQEFDLVSIFRPITKYSYQIERTSKIPYIMQKALRMALNGRPGPVFLSIPSDLLTKDAEMKMPDIEHYHIKAKPQPSSGVIDEATELLLNAKNPAILAGNVIILSEATGELKELAEKLSIPIVPCSGIMDIFPTDHDLFSIDWEKLPELDLLFAVGTNIANLRPWPILPEGAKVIQIELDAPQIGKIYPAHLSIVADPKPSLAALNQSLTNRMTTEDKKRVDERLNRLRELKAQFKSERWPKEEWDETPIRPWRLIKDLREALTSETIVTHDSGSFSSSWIHRLMDFHEPKTCYCCLGGIMGFGLPGALGLKLAAPEKDVIAIVGDGSFLMVSSALSTSIQYNIPITIIINNNSAYMQIKRRQKPPYLGSDLLNPDFVKLAESFGIPAKNVIQPGDLKQALKWAIMKARKGMTSLVDIKTINDPRYANPQMYFDWLDEKTG